MLDALGVPESECDSFHFQDVPDENVLDAPFSRRNQAHIDAIRYIAGETALLPVGMAIGPFSLRRPS